MEITRNTIMNILKSKYDTIVKRKKTYFINKKKEVVASTDGKNIYMYFDVPKSTHRIVWNHFGKAVVTFATDFQVNDSLADVIIIVGLCGTSDDARIIGNYDYETIINKEFTEDFRDIMGNCGSISRSIGGLSINISDLLFINGLESSKSYTDDISVNVINDKKKNPQKRKKITNKTININKISADQIKASEKIKTFKKTANRDNIISQLLNKDIEIDTLISTISDFEWFRFILLLNIHDEAEANLKKSLFSEEVFDKWANKLTNKDWVAIIIRLELDNITDSDIKKDLFSGKMFDKWANKLTGKDWADIIVRLKLDNVIDINIKRFLFSKETFDKWANKLTGKDWADIIIRLELDNIIDINIKRFLFSKETFDKWANKLKGKDWVDIIIRLNLDKQIDRDVKKFLFSKETFGKWLSAIESDYLVELILKLDLDNEIDIDIKKNLFCEEVFDKWSKAMTPEEWVDIITELNLDYEIDRDIKEMLFFNQELFESWSKTMKGDSWTQIILDLDNLYDIDRKIMAFLFDNKKIYDKLANSMTQNHLDRILSELNLDIPLDKHIYQNIKRRGYEKQYKLTSEEKKELIEDDYKLEEFINKTNAHELIGLIAILNPTDEIDAHLKAKILTEKRFISLLTNKISLPELFELAELLDTNNQIDADIKTKIYLNEDILNKIPSNPPYVTAIIPDLLDSLHTYDQVDTNIKKTLLLKENYKSILIKKAGIFHYLGLKHLNEVDRYIKKKFFIDDNNEKLILESLDPSTILCLAIRLNPNDTTDAMIKKKILLNKNHLKKGIQKITGPQALSLHNAFNKDNIIDIEIKTLIFTDHELLFTIISNMDSDDCRKLMDSFDISDKTDDNILKKILLVNENLIMIAEKIDLLRELSEKTHEEYMYILNELLSDEEKFQIIKEKQGISSLIYLVYKKTELLKENYPLKRKLFLNNSYCENIEAEQAETLIFKLLDLNNKEDLLIVDKILFSENSNINTNNPLFIPATSLVLKTGNKSTDIYNKVNNRIIQDEKIFEIILSNSSMKVIIILLNSFDLNYAEDRKKITRIINNKDILKKLKESEKDIQSSFFDFYKSVIKTFENNNQTDSFVGAVEAAISDLIPQKYTKTKIPEGLGSPQSRVINNNYRFYRGIFVINPNGDQLITDLDERDTEIIINGELLDKEHTGWDHHPPTICKSLILFGLPTEEAVEYINDAYGISVYGRNHGFLVIMVEGDEMQIYFPETLTSEQYNALEKELSLVAKSDETAEERMKIHLLIGENAIDDILGRPVYADDVAVILKEEGMLPNNMKRRRNAA